MTPESVSSSKRIESVWPERASCQMCIRDRQNAAFYSILIGNISLKLPDDLLAQLDENPEFRDLLFAYVDVAEPHGRIAA